MSANKLAGRSALVTGAAGFIGANLCLALKTAGARVIATSRNPPAGDDWRKLDLADAGAVDALTAEVRPDFVFHLAAYVIGARATRQGILLGLLDPTQQALAAEAAGRGHERLALAELAKSLPWGAVWDELCRRANTPAGADWLMEVDRYEQKVLSTR